MAFSTRGSAMSEAPRRPRQGGRWERARRALGHVTFTIGLVITLAVVAAASVRLVYTPRDPLEMSIGGRLQGPSEAHPLGTDQFGRDLLSRVMRGAVTSL